MPVPTHDELFNPLLQALRDLGGSASTTEQEDRVAAILRLSPKDTGEIHQGSKTKLGYRLAWARTYLKNYGLLENSSRGIWALTAKGNAVSTVDKRDVKRAVSALQRSGDSEADLPDGRIEESPWEDQLLAILKSMPPAAFERLCQRILRETGFTQVEVTGRSGDGGIDGRGVVRVAGVLSFHVIFQCKRYKGSVGPNVIRELRGAMAGRADKGLLLTTGTITRDGRREAQRDGATPIDMIGGDELVRRLKELQMGVEVRTHIVEDVRIDTGWFDSL